MGTISHDAIIVTIQGEKTANELLALAESIFEKKQISIQGPVVNGYRTLFIGPDGSKEGWDESNKGDEKREKFLKEIKNSDFIAEVICVRYGELGLSIDEVKLE